MLELYALLELSHQRKLKDLMTEDACLLPYVSGELPTCRSLLKILL